MACFSDPAPLGQWSRVQMGPTMMKGRGRRLPVKFSRLAAHSSPFSEASHFIPPTPAIVSRRPRRIQAPFRHRRRRSREGAVNCCLPLCVCAQRQNPHPPPGPWPLFEKKMAKAGSKKRLEDNAKRMRMLQIIVAVALVSARTHSVSRLMEEPPVPASIPSTPRASTGDVCPPPSPPPLSPLIRARSCTWLFAWCCDARPPAF